MDKIIEKKVWYKTKKAWIGTSGIFIVILLYYSFLSSTGSKLKIEKDRINIETIKRTSFQDYIAINGNVMPIRTIYLDAIEGGRVEELIAEEGVTVNKDDIILRLSNPNLSLSILNSEAQLAEKSNFLRNTRVAMEQNKLKLKREILDLEYKILKLERNYNNNNRFYKDSLISREDFLKAKEEFEYSVKLLALTKDRQKQDSIYRKIQVEQMEGSLSQMQKNLKLVRKKMENLEVRSPITGQLGSLNAEIGEQKSQGQRLGFINDLTSFKVRAEIDEYYITRIQTGLVAVFEYGGKDYKLKISKIYPEVKEGRFLVDMKFVGKMPENIRIGQTFRTRLQLGESKETLTIPRGGFYQSSGGQWVFVVSKDGKTAEKRNIKLGNQNPKYYEIISGLKSGEKVITSSYETFKDIDKLVLKD